MIQKKAQYQIKGMNLDLAYQVFNPLYAFEMKNIRINTTDENSLLSINNEKGNKFILKPYENYNLIGLGQFSDYCILFYTNNLEDIIAKFDNNELCTELYKGSLGFHKDYPIRTICSYENEKILKVYWIDSKNPPRVINIAGDKEIYELKFDFLPKLTFLEKVTIERTSGGRFPAGVVLYAITYSDKNLLESNIWYVSPLYYSTMPSRGGSPEQTCNVAYTLRFRNLDENYDYILIYAIVRTSINTTPSVYRIANISTKVDLFTDTGYLWETYDMVSLLSKQLNTFIPRIIASKDNTLFLGNYTLQSKDIDFDKANEELFILDIKDKTYIDYQSISFDETSYALSSSSTGIKTFRDNEWYRIGILFSDEYGTPSNIVYLKDITSRMGNSPEDNTFKLKIVRCEIPIADSDIQKKFKRARLVMVDRESLPHSTLCLGILCPTVYRVNDRYNNSPFALSSWNMRAANRTDNNRYPEWLANMPLKSNVMVGGGEILNQTPSAVLVAKEKMYWKETTGVLSNDRYLCRVYVYRPLDQSYDFEQKRLLRLGVYLARTSNPNVTRIKDCEKKYRVNFIYYFYDYDYKYSDKGVDIYTNSGLKIWITDIILEALEGVSNRENIAASLIGAYKEYDFVNMLLYLNYASVMVLRDPNNPDGNAIALDIVKITSPYADSIARSIGQTFICDHNILTFHSPDVEKYQTLIDNNNKIKYRVVGYTSITDSYFDSYVLTINGPQNTADGLSGHRTYTVNSKYKWGAANVPIWKDNSKVFPVYIWHRISSLGDNPDADDKGRWYGNYDRKVFSNVHYCSESYAFYNETFTEKDSKGLGPELFPIGGKLRYSTYTSNTAPSIITESNIIDTLLYGMKIIIGSTTLIPLVYNNIRLNCILIVIPSLYIINNLTYDLGNIDIISLGNITSQFTSKVSTKVNTVEGQDYRTYLIQLDSLYGDEVTMTLKAVDLNPNNSETIYWGTSGASDISGVFDYLKSLIISGIIGTSESVNSLDPGTPNSFNIAIMKTLESNTFVYLLVPYKRASVITLSSTIRYTDKQEYEYNLILGEKIVYPYWVNIDNILTINDIDYLVYIISVMNLDSVKSALFEIDVIKSYPESPINPESTYYTGFDLGIFSSMGTPRVFNSNEITALSVEIQKNSSCIHDLLVYYGNAYFTHNAGSYRVPVYSASTSVDSNTGIEVISESISLDGNALSDAVLIGYKSTPHVVMPINYKVRGNYFAPPSLPDILDNPLDNDSNNDYGYLWNKTTNPKWSSHMILSNPNMDNILYIAELYLELSVNGIYGDTSEENLSKYTWIPISDWVSLETGGTAIGYGDTFIGRWECLKTYSYSEDSQLSYIDITSVILESDRNLEGRYDSYRNIKKASALNAEKFGLYNEVYDLQDNLFSYRFLLKSNLVDNFLNQICWSKVKTLGEELDTWCLISTLNSKDFQGEYGLLLALVNFLNNLYGFLDNALYRLNYNTRVAISPSDGLPIQISNNYLVDPPLLIKSLCGISSLDSAISTPNNLYFYDNRRHRIYRLSENGVLELSTTKGINSLVSSIGEYNRSLYDINCKDVYFNFKDTSLAFNEDLDEFTSLYDYHLALYLCPLKDLSYTFSIDSIYKQRAGDYNTFFGKYSPFYVKILMNDKPLEDKTFSTVEFTMNSDDISDAFDYMEVENEYQLASLILSTISYRTEDNLYYTRKEVTLLNPSTADKSSLYYNVSSNKYFIYDDSLPSKYREVKVTESNRFPSNLKRKFRIWRADFPRVPITRDRIRNPWVFVKLSKNSDNTNKYRINNIDITYF